jgi:prephenate dehydrogenase
MPKPAAPEFDCVAIVGVGLIGASIGLAIKERKLARHVVGIGRTKKTLEKARERGAVDEAAHSLARGVKEAQLVIVCTPVEKIVETVREAAQHVPPHALLTDAGSTKGNIVAALAAPLPDSVHFVGSHPLAGSEKTGPEHARADLFVDRVVVVTPTKETPAIALGELRLFWEALGARVMFMSPREHDALVAATSHAPHAIASALAAATPPAALELVAGGWLDTTRIAAGDPELWRQILLDNRDHSLRALAKFAKVLSELRQALKAGDGEALLAILEAGKQTRDAVGN